MDGKQAGRFALILAAGVAAVAALRSVHAAEAAADGWLYPIYTVDQPPQQQQQQINLDDFYKQTLAGEFGSATSDPAAAGSGQTAVAPYKEPNHWLIGILKELFTDIDWRTIEEARVQIVKFIHRVEQIVGKFRNVFKGSSSSSSAPSVSSRESEDGAGVPPPLEGRGLFGGNKPDAATKLDAARVKEMLQRVACFVGYVRLMNLSNEALAELDASKVVTNLFGSMGAKRNSSVWKWFG
jgi:hypothetical protein